MKSIGKIGLLLISFFIISSVFLFINIETYGIDGGMRFGAIQLLLIIGIPWFISYSKWANDNIWNRKINKPNETSDNSSAELVEPIDEPNDDNHDILGNINLPSLTTKEDNERETLLKIEELKTQIKSLLESKQNLENSLKKDDLSTEDKERISKEKAEEDYKVIVISIVGVVIFMALIAFLASTSPN